jgi:S-adenosylmethionine decarboxylase
VGGVEWMVDVYGCAPAGLQQPDLVVRLFESIVEHARLNPIDRPVWHQFPFPGGLTAIWMLQESHLTIHTFPEFGSASLNLFCCTPRQCPDWQRLLHEGLGAREVRVRECARDYEEGAAMADPRVEAV